MITTVGFKDNLTLEIICPVCGNPCEHLLADMSMYAMDNGIPMIVLPPCNSGACTAQTHLIAQPLNAETESRFLELHMNRCLFSHLYAADKYDTENSDLATALGAFQTAQASAYASRGEATRTAEFEATHIPTDKAS